jgi:hypothetical protein
MEAAMAEKIDFFDTSNVGVEARRLAFCFNVAARMLSQDGSPLSQAAALFQRSTGLDETPPFNDDEIRYLKLKLIETAAIRDRNESFSIDELEEAANALYLGAKEMNLIRDGGQARVRDKERHFSFPGE